MHVIKTKPTKIRKTVCDRSILRKEGTGGIVLVWHALRKTLQMNKLAAELQETLDEEKKANEKLNELAMSGINEEAMTASHAGSV